jgi:hypothetical protein
MLHWVDGILYVYSAFTAAPQFELLVALSKSMPFQRGTSDKHSVAVLTISIKSIEIWFT